MAIIRTCTTFKESQIFWKFVSTQHRIRKDAIKIFISEKNQYPVTFKPCKTKKMTNDANENEKKKLRDFFDLTFSAQLEDLRRPDSP